MIQEKHPTWEDLIQLENLESTLPNSMKILKLYKMLLEIATSEFRIEDKSECLRALPC